MKKVAVCILTVCTVSLLLYSFLYAGQIAVLRPCGADQEFTEGDVKWISKGMGIPEVHKRTANTSKLTSNGVLDTLSWRVPDAPLVNFGFVEQGDSLAQWFEPMAPCSLLSVRIMPSNFEGNVILDIWDSNYEGNIDSADYVDANGWIGHFEDGVWVSAGHPFLDVSPLGEHKAGPVSRTITWEHHNTWMEIPISAYIDEPFFIGFWMGITAGWGFYADDAEATPFHFFKYYAEEGGGPIGEDGWFIRRYSMWVEAIVYYGDLPPMAPRIRLTQLPVTNSPGPYTVPADIIDDSEVVEALLYWSVEGTPFESVVMSGPGGQGGRYTGDIPGGVADHQIVSYYVTACDNEDLCSVSPTYSFMVFIPTACHITGTGDPPIPVAVTEIRVNTPEGTEFLDCRDSYDVSVEYWLFCSCPASFFKILYKDHAGAISEVFRYSEGYNNCGAGWNILTDPGVEGVLPTADFPYIPSAYPITLPVPDELGTYTVRVVGTGGHRDDDNAEPWAPIIDAEFGDYPGDWDLYLADGVFIGETADDLSWDHYDVDGDCEGMAEFTFTVTYDLEWLPPLAGRGNRGPVFKSGSTVPIKFSLRKNDGTFICDPDIVVKVRDEAGDAVIAEFTMGEGDDYIRCHPEEEYYIANLHTMKNWIGAFTAEIWLPNRSFLIGSTGFTLISKGKGKVTVAVPETYSLSQNYPNPFNPETEITYALPEYSSVRVTVYNILGQEMARLVEDEQPAGYHVVHWNGDDLASGVYFYRIVAGDFTDTKRMVLMK